MKTKIQLITALLLITFTACKKEFKDKNYNGDNQEKQNLLNQKEKETVAKFEHASLVLQSIFSKSPQLRKEFNVFIAAKLSKSGTDEELTFKEIFEAKSLSLPSVKQQCQRMAVTQLC